MWMQRVIHSVVCYSRLVVAQRVISVLSNTAWMTLAYRCVGFWLVLTLSLVGQWPHRFERIWSGAKSESFDQWMAGIDLFCMAVDAYLKTIDLYRIAPAINCMNWHVQSIAFYIFHRIVECIKQRSSRITVFSPSWSQPVLYIVPPLNNMAPSLSIPTMHD